jgi:hypothetical protein
LNLDVAREFSITRNRPTHDILIGDLFAFETQGVRAHTQRAPTQCRLPKLRTSVRELVSLACSFRLRWTFPAPKNTALRIPMPLRQKSIEDALGEPFERRQNGGRAPS